MVKKFALLAVSLCISLSLIIGASVTSFATPPYGYQTVVLGDINNDKVVDAFDYSLIHSYLLGNISLSDMQKVAADVNGDDAITPTDKSLIQNYLLGISGTPVGTFYYVVFGDVNTDNTMDVNDLTFLQSYIDGISNLSIRQIAAADVNRDGVINSTDVDWIYNYLY